MSHSAPPEVAETQLHAELCVSADHPSLAGHFPGKPVVPAVVLIDLLCTELLSGMQANASSPPRKRWRLARIVTARFQSPWLPNEPLAAEMHVNLSTLRARINALVGERAVATANVQLALADLDSEPSRS